MATGVASHAERKYLLRISELAQARFKKPMPHNRVRRHAGFHHANRQIWTFATGQKQEIDSLTRAFSVYRQNEGGTISHGLATALINQDGVIERIWRGNAWTPAEATAAIQAEK